MGGQRRRFGLGVALLVLAGLPLAGHTAGLVTAWGDNSSGQTNVPPNLTNVTAIAAGYDFSLALKADGTVVGWGDNADGETDVPPNLTNVVAIAAGSDFSLALKADGTVAAWGDNTNGQTTVPAGLTNVAAIAGGGSHSMVLVNGAGPPALRVIALWQNLDSCFHDTEPIAWLTGGFDPATFTAQILAARAGNTYLVGSSTNLIGSLNWNTATVPDGVYQLEGLFSGNSPQITRQLFHAVLVNNSVIWHSGVVTTNETWAAGTVHVVEGNLEVASGVVVTIQGGAVTIQIDGALLAAGDTYQLIGPGGTFTATTAQVSDPTTAYATFNLNGAATGNYTLQVTDQNGSRYTLPAPVNVVPASAGRLSVRLEAPANFRVGRLFDAQVVYGNVGNVDVPAPILILSAGGQAALRLLPTDGFSTNDLQVIGASLQGPAGVLRPGQTWSIPFSVLCSEDIPIPLAVDYKSADATDAVDYVELGANVRAPGYSDSDWDALWTSFQSAAGPAWGGLVKLMAQYATIMAQENDLGEEVGNFYSFDDVLAYALAHSLEQVHTSVAGTLYLNDTNHPLAQTYVYLSNADGSQGGADMTNPDGVFRLLSLTNDTYTVAVAGYWLPQPVQVTVPASGSVTGLTVIVRQGGSIAGVVRDQAGATLLTNVSVQAVSESTNGEFAATTGSDGSFLLSGLPPDIYDLTVGGDPFVAQTLTGMILSDGQILTTNFYLAPGASVQGTVAANGAPATNAAVTLWTASGGVAAFTVTDTNGNFSLLGLAAGDYTLEVRAEGYADFTTNAHIEAGETPQQAPVSLLPGATISVIQHFGASQVVTNGIASLYQHGNLVTEQFADTNGFAVFSGLAAGQYTLVESGYGFEATTNSLTVQAGASATGRADGGP